MFQIQVKLGYKTSYTWQMNPSRGRVWVGGGGEGGGDGGPDAALAVADVDGGGFVRGGHLLFNLHVKL